MDNITRKLLKMALWLMVAVVALAAVFSLPVLIMKIIRCLDQKLPLSAITRIADGDGIWFGFWGSYLGCVATVVLGIITIRLDRKINRYTWCKNTADEISQFNSFSVHWISLQNIIDHFATPELEEFSGCLTGQRFLLTMGFTRFPSYYGVLEEEFRWNTDAGDTTCPSLERTLRISTDSDYTVFKYLLDSDDINSFFYTQSLNPETMTKTQRQRCIQLQLHCKNTLYSDDPGYYRPFRVTLQIIVETAPGNSEDGNHDETDSSLKLRIVDQRISCQQVTD